MTTPPDKREFPQKERAKIIKAEMVAKRIFPHLSSKDEIEAKKQCFYLGMRFQKQIDEAFLAQAMKDARAEVWEEVSLEMRTSRAFDFDNSDYFRLRAKQEREK